MPPENLDSLRKQLIEVIKSEIRTCLRSGPTDLEAVAERVESKASMLIKKLAPVLAAAEIRDMIRNLLKKTQVSPEEAEAEARQMEFADMEEFRGIPHNVTYEDKPGHVAYICYLDTCELERDAALILLGKSIAADQQTYLALKAGNEFAARLVRLYGDLPLLDLYRRYKADRRAGGQ